MALTDTSGALAEQYSYEPYGWVFDAEDGSGATIDLTTSTGLAVLKTSRFRNGLDLDPVTELYHNRARPYAPHLGRFPTRDPNSTGIPVSSVLRHWGLKFDISTVLIPTAQYVAGSSLYTYVSNRPTRAQDPTGRIPFSLNPGYDWDEADPQSRGVSLLQDLPGAMREKCNRCCVTDSEFTSCEKEAKTIPSLLAQLIDHNWNRNPKSLHKYDPDAIGGYLCWDWAKGIHDTVQATTREAWDSEQVQLQLRNNYIHFYVRMWPCDNKDKDCQVNVDDGFNEDGWVHDGDWAKSRNGWREMRILMFPAPAIKGQNRGYRYTWPPIEVPPIGP